VRSAWPPGQPVTNSIGTQGPRLESHQTNVHLTAMNPSAPLLLIDVDGVISLFGFDQTEPPEGRFTFVDGLPHYLSATAAEHLDRLHPTFECVWCTGWEDRADEHLPHLLGVPRGWHHLTFPQEPLPAAHWKLSAIDAYAGPDRPVAWIDDAHDDTCHAWADQREGPTLLVATDPAIGITDEHVETLLSWGRAASG
jgi:HAD domain in Swiss Army Knife RNA repair proteins